MQRCRLLPLRFINGVKATAAPSAESVIKADQQTIDRHASQLMASGAGGETLTALHEVAQLRIGGAKFLQATTQSIFNNNDDHPLFFAQRAPRKAGLCPALCSALYKLDIKELTELQGALIPLFLRGKHVIAHAETGSGKSFGIALAVANRVARDSIRYRLHTLILVPTTELALQYDKWLRHFAGAAGQIVQVAVDEVPMEKQFAKLHNVQPHVLVGTPQRIAAIVAASPTLLGEKLRKKVDTLVLDEADIVLTTPIKLMGFDATGADLVHKLFRSDPLEVPAQMIATSATIDGATSQRLNGWMANEKAIRLTTSFVEHTIPQTISFFFFAGSRLVSAEDCLERVLRLIFLQHQLAELQWHQRRSRHDGGGGTTQRPVRPRVLVFTTREEVAEVHAAINSMELQIGRTSRDGPSASATRASAVLLVDAAAASGDGSGARTGEKGSDGDGHRKQHGNRASFNGYRSEQLKTRRMDIIAHDASSVSALARGVAHVGVGPYELGRGLHIGGVTHVLIFSRHAMPDSREFVHCAGRTGRMGAAGDCVAIFPPSCGRALKQVASAYEIPWAVNRIAEVDEVLRVTAAKVDQSLAALSAEDAGDETLGDGVSVDSDADLQAAQEAARAEQFNTSQLAGDPWQYSSMMDAIFYGEMQHQEFQSDQ